MIANDNHLPDCCDDYRGLLLPTMRPAVRLQFISYRIYRRRFA